MVEILNFKKGAMIINLNVTVTNLNIWGILMFDCGGDKNRIYTLNWLTMFSINWLSLSRITEISLCIGQFVLSRQFLTMEISLFSVLT
jgi:hypothetical protein